MYRIIGLLGLLAMVSCSKSGDDVPQKGSLVINLQQSVISINDIDSAGVVFRKTGTNIKERRAFSKKAQQLAATLQGLTPGTWNADIEIYTKASNRLSNQYVIIKPILIEEKIEDVQVAGPGTGWIKRNVKASAGNEVVVIVPDDVYDSYFEIRSRKNQRLYVGIQREAINVNHEVADKTWVCNNDCFNAEGRIVDIDHFMPFTQTIMNTPWTKNEISIGVLDENSQELVLYDRSWNQ